MSGHTPGPWTVTRLIDVDCEGNDYPGAQVSFREVPLGDDEVGHHHDAAVEVWSFRAKADADLISAAPDLLAACKSALHQLNELMSALGEATHPSDVEVTRDLERAIAKAEGR